jgi:hypothetical protein
MSREDVIEAEIRGMSQSFVWRAARGRITNPSSSWVDWKVLREPFLPSSHNRVHPTKAKWRSVESQTSRYLLGVEG